MDKRDTMRLLYAVAHTLTGTDDYKSAWAALSVRLCIAAATVEA